MPFNGSGVFQRVRNWVADATAGVKIRADYHDSEDDNFAAGISNCIARDGQSTVTQNIPFNNKRITGLADPVNAQDAATKASSEAYANTKMPLTGGDFTGTIAIRTNGVAELILDDKGATTNNGAYLLGERNSKGRWLIRLGDGTPESGGNVGSDFDIVAYADDEQGLGRVLSFERKTLRGVVSVDPVAPLGISTKQYTDAKATSEAVAKADAALAAANAQNAATANLKYDRTGGALSGILHTAPSLGTGYGGPVGSIQVNASAGSDAAISFLIPGVWGRNFGMSADGNFYMGGYSTPGQGYKFWTQRDFSSVPATTEQLDALKARIEALESRLA